MTDARNPSLYDAVCRYARIADSVCDDLDWWLQHCPAGSQILELGCGYGRVALPLAVQGCRMTGMDSHQGMLQEARQRDRHQRVHWHQGDFLQARDWPSQPEQWQIILLAANTIGHVHHRDALAELWHLVRRRLSPGGRLLIDTFAPTESVLKNGSSHLLDYADEQGSVYLWEDHRFDPSTSLLHMQWQHRRNPEQPSNGEDVVLRVWSQAELHASLHAAGLSNITFAGDYDGREYRVGDELLLVSARA